MASCLYTTSVLNGPDEIYVFNAYGRLGIKFRNFNLVTKNRDYRYVDQ
jgi:hypothetical protein